MDIKPYNDTELCNILRTFCLEWGAENVEVIVPSSWNKVPTSLGRCKLTYGAEGVIILKTPSYSYSMEVNF